MSSSNITEILYISSFNTSSGTPFDSNQIIHQNYLIFFIGDNYSQKTITSTNTYLAVTTADLIISKDLAFYLSPKTQFVKVLNLEKNVSKFYQPPNRKLISKDLLYVIHDQNKQRNLSMIKKEADIFRLLFSDGGATISRTPLLKILASGKHFLFLYYNLLVVIFFKLMVNKKYGTFICRFFFEHINNDSNTIITDVVMFDRASNIQLGGKLIKFHYPMLTVMRVAEQKESLFFNDAYKMTIVNQRIKYHEEIYNLFGSGIYKKPRSIFKS